MCLTKPVSEIFAFLHAFFSNCDLQGQGHDLN